MKRCYYALTLFLLICCNSSLLVQGVSPHGVTDHQKLLAELDHLQTSLDKCDQEKKHLQEQINNLQEELDRCNGLNEELQASVFGDNDASTVSHDPTYADSDASDEPDSPSMHIEKMEHYSETLEERLQKCEQAKNNLREVEQQLEEKQEALRNCQQLSGAAKVGAGAAGLSQLKSMDKNLSFKDTRGFILKSLNEGGFILFKQAAKETIPQVPIVHWERRSLLDTHEVAEITAEALKAYAHDKDPKDLALFSAQVYARVKIMNQLDKHGFKKMTDKLEYHTRTLVRGLVCKGIDIGIATLVETYYRP